MMLRQRCVASDHVLLNDDSAADGFDGTVENGEKAVTGGFDELAVVPHDAGLDEVALDPFHTAVRSLFIDLHEAAVASDITGHNRGKTARLTRGLTAGLARLDIADISHDSDRSPCTANRSVGIQLTAHELHLWNRIIPPRWGKAFGAPVTSWFHLISRAFYHRRQRWGWLTPGSKAAA